MNPRWLPLTVAGAGWLAWATVLLPAGSAIRLAATATGVLVLPPLASGLLLRCRRGPGGGLLPSALAGATGLAMVALITTLLVLAEIFSAASALAAIATLTTTLALAAMPLRSQHPSPPTDGSTPEQRSSLMPEPIPVLCYHSVSDEPPAWIAPFTVTPNEFERQLDSLAESGRTVVPLARLVETLKGNTPLDEPAAVLTFDDGFKNFHTHVAPMLLERDMPATVFVTANAVSDSNTRSLLPPDSMLAWDDVRALDKSGFDVGAHSRTHPELDVLPPVSRVREIDESKLALENALAHEVRHFAYPHGYSSPAVRRAVHDAGFTAACAVGEAFSSSDDDPLRISRLTVRSTTTPEQFQDWLDGTGARIAPLRPSVRSALWRTGRRVRARFADTHSLLEAQR